MSHVTDVDHNLVIFLHMTQEIFATLKEMEIFFFFWFKKKTYASSIIPDKLLKIIM